MWTYARIIIDYSNFDFVPLCPRKRQGKDGRGEEKRARLCTLAYSISALLSAIVRA